MEYPKLKMKTVEVRATRSSDKVDFFNEHGKPIVTILKFPPNHQHFCDVILGPDARLDEIATVISMLMATIMKGNSL